MTNGTKLPAIVLIWLRAQYGRPARPFENAAQSTALDQVSGPSEWTKWWTKCIPTYGYEFANEQAF